MKNIPHGQNSRDDLADNRGYRSSHHSQSGCVDKYRDNLIEEIADVLIIINELQLIYDISNNDIENIKKYKMDRMDYRIKNNL